MPYFSRDGKQLCLSLIQSRAMKLYMGGLETHHMQIRLRYHPTTTCVMLPAHRVRALVNSQDSEFFKSVNFFGILSA
jgi:hypothetical protein